MTTLRFTTKSLTGCVLVTVSGELDIATKPELIHYVNNIISTRVGMVVLDLSGITFIDAQGLSALIMIKRQAQLVHTELVLAGTPPVVLSLLRITRLDKHFCAFPQMARRITFGSSTISPSGPRRNRTGNGPWPDRAESERRRTGNVHRHRARPIRTAPGDPS